MRSTTRSPARGRVSLRLYVACLALCAFILPSAMVVKAIPVTLTENGFDLAVMIGLSLLLWVFLLSGDRLDVLFTEIRKKGCRHIIVDGVEHDLADELKLNEYDVTHMDVVVESVAETFERRHDIGGLRFTYEPETLRFFQARFEPI